MSLQQRRERYIVIQMWKLDTMIAYLMSNDLHIRFHIHKSTTTWCSSGRFCFEEMMQNPALNFVRKLILIAVPRNAIAPDFAVNSRRNSKISRQFCVKYGISRHFREKCWNFAVISRQIIKISRQISRSNVDYCTIALHLKQKTCRFYLSKIYLNW